MQICVHASCVNWALISEKKFTQFLRFVPRVKTGFVLRVEGIYCLGSEDPRASSTLDAARVTRCATQQNGASVSHVA